MDIKAELLLTDKEIQEAVDNSQVVWLSDEHGTDVDEEATILLERASVAKAQATKAVEMILSRIKELEVHDSYSYRLVGYRISVEELNAFESELLDEIREGK